MRVSGGKEQEIPFRLQLYSPKFNNTIIISWVYSLALDVLFTTGIRKWDIVDMGSHYNCTIIHFPSYNLLWVSGRDSSLGLILSVSACKVESYINRYHN